MNTVPNPAQDRVYPLTPPATDRRFTLGLIFAIAQVLVDAGYPPITAGGDLVALQQAVYGFIYANPGEVVSPGGETDTGQLVRAALAALGSLWDCRHELTGAERALLAEAAAGVTASDEDFAQQFLERQGGTGRWARLHALAVLDGPTVRLSVRGRAAAGFNTEAIRRVLDGGPAPQGLDPETIAAARRIARALNDRGDGAR